MLNQSNAHQVFNALGDPTRRALLERLSRGPMSVSELGKPFDISLAAVVQHLQVLEQCRIVKTEKVGRVRSCRIEGEGLRVAERWINARRAAWERHFDRLGEVLGEPDLPQQNPPKKRKKHQ